MLREEAAIFTDGRYTLQVREQVDGRNWQYVGVPETSVAAWLGEHAPGGARIGFDPWVHTKGWAEAASKALADKGAELVAVDTQSDRRGLDRAAGAFRRQADRARRSIYGPKLGGKTRRGRRLACRT